MDDHALETFERAQAAASSSRRDVEVVPVEIPPSRGSPGGLLSEDESLSKMKPDKLRKLKPFFKQVGRGGGGGGR
jgi:acetyl-CoA C-acetyltransferase